MTKVNLKKDSTHCSKVISKVKVFKTKMSQTPRSRSQCQK